MRSYLSYAVEAVLAAFLICGCGQSDQGSSTRAEDVARDELDIEVEDLAPELRQRVEQAYGRIGEDPTDAAALGQLGMLMHAYGRLDAAKRYYRKAEELDPASFRWIYLRGLVLDEQGRTGDAAQAFSRAVEKNPASIEAKLRLAGALVESGGSDRGFEVYERVSRSHPEVGAAYLGMGRVKAEQGRHDEALNHFQRAAGLLKDYGPLHYALALSYRGAGHERNAKKSLALYKRLGPTRQDPFADLILDEVRALETGSYLYHLDRGRRLEAAGRLEQAVEEYQKAAQADPKRPQAHVNLISAYGRLEQFGRAEEHFRKALAINPELEECHYNLGVLRTKQSRFSDAAEAYQRALEINPFSADSHNNLGYVLEQLGKPSEALRHYRGALDHRPNFRLAHFNLGKLLFAGGKRKEAIGHFEQTAEPEDAQTPQYLLVLARAHRAAGNDEQATAYGRKAKTLAEQFGQTEVRALADREFGGTKNE